MSFTGNRKFLHHFTAIAVVCLALLPAGCASSRSRQQAELPPQSEECKMQLVNKPEALHPYYRQIMDGDPHDLVLNQLRLGLAAMDMGEDDLAAKAFDSALEQIESVFSDGEAAARARSFWYDEGQKDFKGEPYERAMAYYYRGLLYLKHGDFENARACFRSGVLQDAFAEEKQYQSDFVLLIFLEGWANQCLGQMEAANRLYAEARKIQPEFIPPAPDANLLVLAETGASPRKVADGVGRYQLKYRRGKGITEQQTRVTINDTVGLTGYAIEDIYWQSTTRGGRAVDKIIQGKVAFKQGSAAIGHVTGAITRSPALWSSEAGAIAGASLGVVSLVSYGLSMNVNPRADTRYWNNLPDLVHAITGTVPCQSTPLVLVEYLDESNAITRFSADSAEAFTTDGTHFFAWTRSRSALVRAF